MIRPRCEDRYDGGQCTFKASWRVQAGTRQTDAQLSCSKHLARTCQAIAGAEGKKVHLTITAL